MPYSTLKIFKELNLEAQHAKDVGLEKASDKEIIDYTITHKYVLITKDLEFGNTSIFPTKHQQGLIIVRLPFYFKSAKIAELLKEFLRSIVIKDLEKKLVILELGKYRIRSFK